MHTKKKVFYQVDCPLKELDATKASIKAEGYKIHSVSYSKDAHERISKTWRRIKYYIVI